ncbi:MAG: hypothetical protein ACR2KU_07560 [Gammaproteobacteria bacterium]
MSSDREEEIDRNYQAFTERLPSLLTTHRGKFALMRKGDVIEFFDTARDAYVTGQKLYDDGVFSVQEVINTPVDLGYFSRAVPQPQV